MRRSRTLRAGLLTTLIALTAGAATLTPADAESARAGVQPRAAAAPTLQVTTLASGLDIPWDVKPIDRGRLLITERTTKRLLIWDRGTVRPVAFPSATVWAAGETGLMGLAVDPSFASNRRFYTCQGGYRTHGRHDVRVNAWTLAADSRSARLSRTLLHGIQATSGRHGGCRLLIPSYGALMVGTGDAAVGTNPRNKSALGGKTLRLNRFTGKPWPKNPFIRSRSLNARYVTSFGHRNVQGLTQRPSDGAIWTVEQGTTRDDEVNRISRGADYGYNPVPGYNESVPMTDQRLRGKQVNAAWHSGSSTIATSGAAWVHGRQWGADDGTLAVAALKGERLLFMRFTAAGKLVYVRTPTALRGYGRLRSVTSLADGDLLVTTSNGAGNDRLLRVRPAA